LRSAGKRGTCGASHRPYFNWGNVTSERGDYEGAKGFYEEGLALSRKLDDTALLTSYLIRLGYESLLEGDPERGATLNEEAVVLLGERGHKGKLQDALDNLGWAALMRGDQQQSRSLHEESLELSRELGDKLIAAESLEGLACSAARGEERAARLFGAAETLREAVGYNQAPRESAAGTVPGRRSLPGGGGDVGGGVGSRTGHDV
jgi:tetratricopeptide (TPR) repeat protein